MIVRLVAGLSVLVMIALARPTMAEDAPLRMGLLPTNAPLTVIALYHPWAEHLQQALGRPIQTFVARSFRVYFDDLEREDYDVIIPAPHYGVIALDHNYEPLFRFKPDLRPMIAVAKGGAIRSGAHLQGRRVLTADRLTAVSVVAEHWLEVDFGLTVGRDYQLEDSSNHTTAIRAVALGDADAAITTPPALLQVPTEIRAAVDVLPSRLSVPQQFVMVHRRLGRDAIDRIRAALAAFPQTEGGGAFFAKGYEGLAPVTGADVEAARPYADLVLRRLRTKE